MCIDLKRVLVLTQRKYVGGRSVARWEQRRSLIRDDPRCTRMTQDFQPPNDLPLTTVNKLINI
jgi:hypothetical protein